MLKETSIPLRVSPSTEDFPLRSIKFRQLSNSCSRWQICIEGGSSFENAQILRIVTRKMTQFMIGRYFNAKRTLNLTGPINSLKLDLEAESASLNRK